MWLWFRHYREVVMLFLEDIQVGHTLTSPTFIIDREEMVRFAERWDQHSIHLDDAAADALYGGGGITAPSAFLTAIRSRLLNQLPDPKLAVIAAGGWDELRFHAPARPGDTLRLEQEFLARRDSQSKPDRGVLTSRISLINQDDITVFSHVEATIVRRRNVRIDTD
jgi:acyl dehydratase